MSGVVPFSLPLARPLTSADGALDRREGFLIRVGTDPAGLGEASPLPGWTESLADCRDAIASARPADDDDPESAASLPAMAETPAARHGLELALLDREAIATRRPLYRHLGGERRVSTVPVNATVGDGDLEETVAAAREAVARGFRTVKVKVGARSVDADVERLTAVRDAVGDVDLRADANGAWTVDQATMAIGRLGGVVSLVEQPLEPAALSAHAKLRGHGIEIALDEALWAHPVDEVLEAGAADVLVLKPMVLGGVGRAKALADAARSRGTAVVVTTTIDAAVARAGAVHLAAAIDGDRACGLATADWLADDVADDPAPVVDGGVSVPQAAGHGVTVEALE